MQEQTQQARILDLKTDYELLFTSERGQRVLHDICASGNLYRSSYVSENTAYATVFNEGKRTLALHIKYMAKPKSKKEQTGETKR